MGTRFGLNQRNAIQNFTNPNLQKGKALPIGTVRTYDGKQYKKESMSGKWEDQWKVIPKGGGSEKGVKEEKKVITEDMKVDSELFGDLIDEIKANHGTITEDQIFDIWDKVTDDIMTKKQLPGLIEGLKFHDLLKEKPKEPRGFADYKKAVSKHEKLQEKLKELQDEVRRASKEKSSIFLTHLAKMGFEEKELLNAWGDYEKSHIFKVPGGKDFKGGNFFIKNDRTQDQAWLYYRDANSQNKIDLKAFSDLNDLKVWSKEFAKNPSKALAKLESTFNEDRRIQSGVKDIKSNYFTGKKKVGDVAAMTPREIMNKFKIPNTGSTTRQGKRSTVYQTDNDYLEGNIHFFNDFKEYYEKYGKPVKVETAKFDTRENDYDYQSSVQGEREWSYTRGEGVIVTFKDEDGDTIQLNN